MYGSFSEPVSCAAKSEAASRRPASFNSLGKANWTSLYSRPLDRSYWSAADQYEPGSSSAPFRHIAVLFIFQFFAVLLVAVLALDVIALGAGRLPTGAGTEARF